MKILTQGDLGYQSEEERKSLRDDSDPVTVTNKRKQKTDEKASASTQQMMKSVDLQVVPAVEGLSRFA